MPSLCLQSQYRNIGCIQWGIQKPYKEEDNLTTCLSANLQGILCTGTLEWLKFKLVLLRHAAIVVLCRHLSDTITIHVP